MKQPNLIPEIYILVWVKGFVTLLTRNHSLSALCSLPCQKCRPHSFWNSNLTFYGFSPSLSHMHFDQSLFFLLCCPLQVKCYHRRAQSADRDTVFRLQFHTCTIHGSQLWFGKGELDEACTGEFIQAVLTADQRSRITGDGQNGCGIFAKNS